MDEARYNMIAPTVEGVMREHVAHIYKTEPEHKASHEKMLKRLFDADVLYEIVSKFDECMLNCIEQRCPQKKATQVKDLFIEISLLPGQLEDFQTVYAPYGYLTYLKSALENLKRKQHLINLYFHLHFCIQPNQIVVNMTAIIPSDETQRYLIALDVMTEEERMLLEKKGL